MDADRQRALAFLEQIQKQDYERLGLERHWLSPEFVGIREEHVRNVYAIEGRAQYEPFEEFRTRFLAELDAHTLTPESSYQNPGTYTILAKMVGNIEAVLTAHRVKLDPLPLFGTLPTGRMNALVQGAPGGRYSIVLIEDGLFGFARHIARTICESFQPIGDVRDLMRSPSAMQTCLAELRSRREIPEKFLELLLTYIGDGHPDLPEPYTPKPEGVFLPDMLTDAMGLFVVAHEYGHCVSGHLHENMSRKPLLEAPLPLETRQRWGEELQADLRGLEYMVLALHKQNVPESVSFCGAELFFCCAEVVERAVNLIKTGCPELQHSTTHPPPSMRRRVLREKLYNAIPDQRSADAFGLAEVLNGVMDYFWEYSEPTLMHGHRSGMSLAPGWN